MGNQSATSANNTRSKSLRSGELLRPYHSLQALYTNSLVSQHRKPDATARCKVADSSVSGNLQAGCFVVPYTLLKLSALLRPHSVLYQTYRASKTCAHGLEARSPLKLAILVVQVTLSWLLIMAAPITAPKVRDSGPSRTSSCEGETSS